MARQCPPPLNMQNYRFMRIEVIAPVAVAVPLGVFGIRRVQLAETALREDPSGGETIYWILLALVPLVTCLWLIAGTAEFLSRAQRHSSRDSPAYKQWQAWVFPALMFGIFLIAYHSYVWLRA
jgi:hypothetical protein